MKKFIKIPMIALCTTCMLISGCTAQTDITDMPDVLPEDVWTPPNGEETGATPTLPEVSPTPETPPANETPATPETPPAESAPPANDGEEKPKVMQCIRVLTDGLNVRSKATTSSSSLGTVNDDSSLLYLGKEGNFYKTYYRGKIAYISANQAYTAIFTIPLGGEEVESVILEGCKYIGVPYVYGAPRYFSSDGKVNSSFSTSKFDCSSLTQYVYYKGGKVVLRETTRTQILQGKSVARSNIQRGDLLFFTNSARKNKTGIERVGHVAIYLGDNYILHTASDYCKIEGISALRWSYYIEARRVL